MRELAWDDTLSVDVDEIDDDHRILISIVNSLNRAIAEDESPNFVAAILDELVNYTVYHFSHEERLMLQYDYEGYGEHREEHVGLIGSAKKLRENILHQEGPVVDEELEFLEGWLTEHILSDDKALGSFLSEVL